MAYQNVGTPRFYINCIEWMHSLGQISSEGSFGIHKYFTTSAPNPEYNGLGDGYNDTRQLPKFGGIPYNAIMGTKSFIAILGHNLKSADCEMLFQEGSPNFNGISSMGKEVNCGSATYIRPDYDGFSLTTGDVSHWQQTGNPNHIRFESGLWDQVDANPYNGLGGVTTGAIILGTYYDMPNAPNLSLTMSREYGGTKEFTTYNGGSMSNTMWSKPPKWGDLGAWELGAGNPSLSRSGRRTWDLKFSYMADSDLWGSNQSLSTIMNTATGLDGTDHVFATEVSWTGDCETHPAPNNFGYSTFNGVSRTGFHAVHDDHSSRAGTDKTISITSGLTYRVTFNLSIASGVPPVINIKSQFNGISLTADDEQRAVNGGNVMTFIANISDSTASIGVFHYGLDEDSEFTISDIHIQIGYTGFNYNLLTDENFFSQVWHKTLGGTLPFIFQPDSSNNNPDQFAICKFKDNTLKATQSAYNVYDISLSIEEVW